MGDIGHGSTQTSSTVKSTTRRHKILCLVRKERLAKAGKRAPWVKCLPGKHEDPGSVPRTQVEMLGVAVHACNPTAALTEMGRSLGSLAYQSTIHGEFQARERACLNKTRWEEPETRYLILLTSVFPRHIHM